MTEQLLALALLANMKYTEAHEIPNGYNSQSQVPWMLFICEGGTFKMGWRKRVLSVTWTAGEADPITEEELKWITHGPDHFHAHGWPQALLFLTRVIDQLKLSTRLNA